MTQAVSLQPDLIVAAPSGDEEAYEVVDGRRVEKPPMSAYEVRVATILVVALEAFVKDNQLGRAVGEMLFALRPDGGLQRKPDVAFISYQTWPRDRPVPRTNAWAVVPELAIEVVSPTNGAAEILVRVLEFFQAGTRQVWVVYPRQHQVHMWRSPTQVQVLTHPDQIEGDPLLPGFRLPVAALVEEEGPGV